MAEVEQPQQEVKLFNRWTFEDVKDATCIGSAGIVRRQAVDISPLRRVNQAIYLSTTGARESAFRNIKTIAEYLSELINAAKGSSNSYAIKEEDEIERVAKANQGQPLSGLVH